MTAIGLPEGLPAPIARRPRRGRESAGYCAGKRWLLRGKALAILGGLWRGWLWAGLWADVLGLVLRWSLVSVMIRFCNFDRRDT